MLKLVGQVQNMREMREKEWKKNTIFLMYKGINVIISLNFKCLSMSPLHRLGLPIRPIGLGLPIRLLEAHIFLHCTIHTWRNCQ